MHPQRRRGILLRVHGKRPSLLTYGTSLGNARVNFRANGAAIVNIEDHHYYPFGMKMEGIGSSTVTNKYTYNYKELNDDFGLNWHDYGARWYDAALGRWWSVDPLAEPQANYSPYAYTFNNPLSFMDPTGMMGEEIGADGLTNEQWIESSRQQNQSKADTYKHQNRDTEVTQKRNSDKYKLPVVYYVNIADFSVSDLTSIFDYAKQIFVKNGISGLRFVPRTTDEAKRYKETPEFTMFIALVNSEDYFTYYEPGLILLDIFENRMIFRGYGFEKVH